MNYSNIAELYTYSLIYVPYFQCLVSQNETQVNLWKINYFFFLISYHDESFSYRSEF